MPAAKKAARKRKKNAAAAAGDEAPADTPKSFLEDVFGEDAPAGAPPFLQATRLTAVVSGNQMVSEESLNEMSERLVEVQQQIGNAPRKQRKLLKAQAAELEAAIAAATPQEQVQTAEVEPSRKPAVVRPDSQLRKNYMVRAAAAVLSLSAV